MTIFEKRKYDAPMPMFQPIPRITKKREKDGLGVAGRKWEANSQSSHQNDRMNLRFTSSRSTTQGSVSANMTAVLPMTAGTSVCGDAKFECAPDGGGRRGMSSCIAPLRPSSATCQLRHLDFLASTHVAGGQDGSREMRCEMGGTTE